MVRVGAAEGHQRTALADVALTGAASLWFLATLAGQTVFFFYIAAFYGPPTFSGNFQGWDENPFLRKGYIEGDEAGNLAFAAHVIVAAIVAFCGMIQLVPQVRVRAAALHRWNGRIFLFAATAAAVSGLFLVWMRGEIESVSNATAISLNGALILFFAALAWSKAVQKDFAAHRRWAMRLFLVANGVFFLRLMMSAWLVIMKKNPGGLFHVMEFASFLFPLAALELFLRARESGPSIRFATAGALLIVAGLTIVGIFGFVMIFVRRIMGIS